jgi:hypothetical protein
MTPGQNTETIIRERAYHIWESAGRPDGQAERHWFQAVEEIAATPATKPKTRAKKAATATKTEAPAKKAPAKKAPAKKAAPKK